MRLTKTRIYVLIVLLACAAYATWWWAEWYTVELDIGPETTVITGPLNPDGTVNYVAYINAQLSEGVTPENNAAIGLARAVGPTLFHEDVRERAFEIIGMVPPPEHDDYFELLDDRHELEFLEATRAPWSAEKLPAIADWLKINAKPLALIETATTRRHIYIPLVSLDDPPSAITIMVPGLTELSEAGKAFIARAMLKCAGQDLAGAWKDLLTARRLARLISQGGSLIEGLVGMAIEAEACSACRVVVAGHKASAAQLRTWGRELDALAPLTDIRKAMAAERFSFLDAVMMLYRAQSLAELDGDVSTMGAVWVDWNEVLRRGNAWYDRSQAASALRDIAERHARLKEMEHDLEKMRTEVSGGSVLDVIRTLTPPGRRRQVTETVTVHLLSVVYPSLTRIADNHDRVVMESEMLQVAAVLALHKAETGRFPAKPADLAPKYLKALPRDRFSGKALVYKREGKGCVVYSVGLNLTDDGGIDNRGDEDVDPDDEKDDIVIRFTR